MGAVAVLRSAHATKTAPPARKQNFFMNTSKPKPIYSNRDPLAEGIVGTVLRLNDEPNKRGPQPPVDPTVQGRVVAALDCIDRLENQTCMMRQSLFADRPELAPVQDRPMSIDDMLNMAVCRLEQLVNEACSICCRLN